jgi:hypothetical protein
MFSTQEITGAQKALAALTSSDEWKKFTAPQQAELTARLQAIDAIQRETIEWKKKNEEQAKSIKLYEEEQQKLEAANKSFTESIGSYAEQNTFLAKSIELVGQDDLARQKLIETMEKQRLLAAAMLTGEAKNAAIVEELYAKRIELIEQMAKATEHFAEVQAYNTIFSNAFADSLVAIVDGTKSLKEAFKDMERTIVQSINRIAAQKLADALFGVGPGKSGGIGEIFSKLFSGGGFDFSKILGWLFGGGGSSFGGSAATFGPGSGFEFGMFANGGNPPVGRLSLVGENGPEFIFPRSPMTVAPINGKGGGGVNITQHLTVMPGASTQSARQAASKVRDATVRAIKDR